MPELTARKANPSETPIKFGTDGWRAVIGKDYTFENVRAVTHATAQTFPPERGTLPKVAIGYDHRFLAEKFAAEARNTLAEHDFRACLLTEAVTSPLLSFITWKEKAPFGIMITASHNPPEWLGFKVKGTFGGSISQETAGEIEKNLLPSGESYGVQNTSRENGTNTRALDYSYQAALKTYFSYLAGHIDFSLLRQSKIPATFDAMYGPGGKITRSLFETIRSKTAPKILHENREPLFGGLNPEPIEQNLSELKAFVRKTKTLGGFALDGDGDRLGLVDEKGQYLTPQQVFALILYYLAHEKKLQGKVVQAVSLGYLSERIAQDYTLPFLEVPVGFKYVAEEILKGNVIAGGEESGGYSFSRTNHKKSAGPVLPERDGILSSLLLIEMCVSTGKKISQVLSEIQRRYGTSAYLRKDIRLKSPIWDKSVFVKKVMEGLPQNWLGMKIKEMRTLDGLKVLMDDGSWFLIRPSGTEPLLRTYAEFPSKNLSAKSLDKLSLFLKSFLKGSQE